MKPWNIDHFIAKLYRDFRNSSFHWYNDDEDESDIDKGSFNFERVNNNNNSSSTKLAGFCHPDHDMYHYSTLCHWSHSILDFFWPSPSSGATFQMVRALVDSNKDLNGAGFYQLFSVGMHGASVGYAVSQSEKCSKRPVFAYGKLFLDDARLEGILAKRLGKRWTISASGNSSFKDADYHANIQVQHDHPVHSVESNFCLEDKLLGLRYLYHFNKQKQFSLGGELYYLFNENSGGLSIGGRYIAYHKWKRVNSEKALVSPQHLTFTWNPIMGHVSFTNTFSVWPPIITTSARYDVNIYSFESDITVGLLHKGPEPDSDAFQIRFSLEKKLLAILYTRTFNKIPSSSMLSTTSNDNENNYRLDANSSSREEGSRSKSEESSSSIHPELQLTFGITSELAKSTLLVGLDCLFSF